MSGSIRRGASILLGALVLLASAQLPRELWTDVYNPGNVGRAAIGGAANLGPRVFVVSGLAHEERSKFDWSVRAYKAGTGELLWEDFDLDARDAVAVCAGGGRVHVLGTVVPERGDHDWLVRTYRPRDGRLLWERRFDRAGKSDNPVQLALADGVLLVGGISRDGSRADFHVRALRAADGALLWEHIYDDDSRNDYLRDMTASAGRVYLAGESASDFFPSDGQGRDLVLRVIRLADGAPLWSAADATLPSNRALAVAANRKLVAVTGQAVDVAANRQLGLVRVFRARDGRRLWSDSVAGDSGQSSALHDVAIAGPRVIVAGDGFEIQGGSRYLVRAYRARTGRIAWEDRLPEERGAATELLVHRRRVYVAGNTDSGLAFGENLIVSAHRAGNGRLLWRDEHTDGGADFAGALARSGRRVLVVGTTRGPAPVPNEDQGAFTMNLVVRSYVPHRAESDQGSS